LLSALARGGWIFRSTRVRADRKIQRFRNFQRVWRRLRHYRSSSFPLSQELGRVVRIRRLSGCAARAGGGGSMKRLSIFVVIVPACLLSMATSALAEAGVCRTDSSHEATICHVPPGNPDNPQTICVTNGAARSHFAKHAGDSTGPCGPRCGDGQCSAEEHCDSCPQDCGECVSQCGDGQCDGDEDCATCAEDCGECPSQCGDGRCNGDETCSTCPQDCASGSVCCQGAGSCSVAACCDACDANTFQCFPNGVCSSAGSCE
jgi:hypothetical protein